MNDPRPFSEGLEQVMRHLAAPRVDTVRTIFEHWPAVVGPGVAEHTRPLSFDDGCLVVAVDDPAWASQLRWSHDSLVRQLREAVGTTEVDRIRTTVRPLA